MERRAGGRRVLDALARLRHRYHRHVDRYHAWNETPYRIFTWLVAIIVILVMLAALAGTFKAGLHFYRHFQEKHGQKEIQAFLARDDYRNAILCARKVLTINPNNIAACRVMAELADRAHSPVTLDWLQRIVQNEPTVENKLILASAGLNYQQPPFSLTIQILDELAPVATNNAAYQVVAASLAMYTSRLTEAQAHLEAAAKLEPTNELFRMSIAILKLASTNMTEQSQSRAVLEKMRSDENIGLLALRVLVADRLQHQDATAANIYSSQLLANPHATLEDRLQNLQILRQLKSDDFTDRLQTVQLQVATNAPAMQEVSAWMQANDLVAESLDWLTSLSIPLLDQRPVQMALAQGYLQSSQWTKLLNTTSQSNWGDLEFLRFALIFRAWSQLGATGAADSNWNAAMGEAAGHREAMTQLLQLADSWHLQQKMEAVLLQMVQESPGEHRTEQELESMYFNSGNTLGLHQLYTILNSQFPDDASYKNNLTATALLLKIDVRKTCQLAADVYAKQPERSLRGFHLRFRASYAGPGQAGTGRIGKTPAGRSRTTFRGALLWSAARGHRKIRPSHALASDRPNQRPSVAGRTGFAFHGPGKRPGFPALIIVHFFSCSWATKPSRWPDSVNF